MRNIFGPINLTAEKLILYFFAVNLTSSLLMGIDKYRAQQEEARRIPENSLYFVSLIGGAFGSVLGMKLFRHKISTERKLKFIIIISIITVMNIFLYGVIVDQFFYDLSGLI